MRLLAGPLDIRM